MKKAAVKAERPPSAGKKDSAVKERTIAATNDDDSAPMKMPAMKKQPALKRTPVAATFSGMPALPDGEDIDLEAMTHEPRAGLYLAVRRAACVAEMTKLVKAMTTAGVSHVSAVYNARTNLALRFTGTTASGATVSFEFNAGSSTPVKVVDQIIDGNTLVIATHQGVPALREAWGAASNGDMGGKLVCDIVHSEQL
jgi:hypothetical protein